MLNAHNFTNLKQTIINEAWKSVTDFWNIKKKKLCTFHPIVTAVLECCVKKVSNTRNKH